MPGALALSTPLNPTHPWRHAPLTRQLAHYLHKALADQAAVAPARQYFDHGKRKMHAGARAAPGVGHAGAQLALCAHLRKQLARHLPGALPVAVVGLDLGVAKSSRDWVNKASSARASALRKWFLSM